jgi:ABC-2 type transport system ATP-binding protein
MGIIKATNLEKHYPSPENPLETFAAVNGISLDIKPKEIFGLLGPNGAGKTTTLEMIEGDVLIDGMNVSKQPYEVKKIIGVQLQSNEYFDRLNLSDLLLLFATLYSTSVDPAVLLAKVNLENKINALPDDLSGGQKQRFSIACALVNHPKILFLDEPTTGLDPQAKRNLWNLAKTLNEEGMTIVLTTHNMEEAEYLCDRIAIMDQGSIIAQDTPQQLILDYAPEPPEIPMQGNIEDVFLALTGHGLRD